MQCVCGRGVQLNKPRVDLNFASKYVVCYSVCPNYASRNLSNYTSISHSIVLFHVIQITGRDRDVVRLSHKTTSRKEWTFS